MYAANLTGDLDEMLYRHDHVLAHGGICIMASVNSDRPSRYEGAAGPLAALYPRSPQWLGFARAFARDLA